MNFCILFLPNFPFKSIALSDWNVSNSSLFKTIKALTKVISAWNNLNKFSRINRATFSTLSLTIELFGNKIIDPPPVLKSMLLTVKPNSFKNAYDTAFVIKATKADLPLKAFANPCLVPLPSTTW